MTKTYHALSAISITLSLLVITTSNASAFPSHSKPNSKSLAKIKNYANNLTPVYQGKCDRNPELPGC